jgi:hypothetical protein
MARPVYPYELHDPDFSWLLDNFRENNPQFTLHENPCQPLVLLDVGELKTNGAHLALPEDFIPLLPPREPKDG